MHTRTLSLARTRFTISSVIFGAFARAAQRDVALTLQATRACCVAARCQIVLFRDAIV
jgi:hypothetical protein